MVLQDDLEAKSFLSTTDHGHDDIRSVVKSRRSALSYALHFLLALLLLFMSFFFGRYIAPSPNEAGGLAPYSPATRLIEYHRKKFDQGYGENTTDGRRIVYGGPANPEIDAAWEDLEFGKYVRLTEEEAHKLEEPTARVHKGGGYIASLDVYHQLHCLNFIRMAFQPHYYKFKQPPEAVKHHVAHCINDLRQTLQCSADVTPMGFTRTTWEGKVAYDPHFEVKRNCRDWDTINNWARERSLFNDPDLDLIII